MKSPLTGVVCLAWALVLAGIGSPPAASPMDAATARQAVIDRIASATTVDIRLGRLMGIAYMDPDIDPAIRDAARLILNDYSPRDYANASSAVYEQLTPENQVEVLTVWDRVIPSLKGFSYTLNDLIGKSAGSPDPRVHTAADGLVVKYRITAGYFPLRKRCNQSKGEDRIQAIETIGGLGDGRASYFLPALLDSKEKGVREAVYTALAQLGRAGTVAIKQRLADPDPAQRLLALRALMPIAVVDDLPPLYLFAQSNPGMDPALKDQLYELIARLEVIRDQGVETPRQ